MSKNPKLSKETKELFDAPWKPYRPIVGLTYEIKNNRDETIFETSLRDYACQGSHLPELYDALVRGVRLLETIQETFKISALKEPINDWKKLIKTVKEGE